MKTQRGQKNDRKRKYLAEPPFAWIKSVMGLSRFSLRGTEKVRGEWDLACLAMNLKRKRGHPRVRSRTKPDNHHELSGLAAAPPNLQASATTEIAFHWLLSARFALCRADS